MLRSYKDETIPLGKRASMPKPILILQHYWCKTPAHQLMEQFCHLL